MPVGPNELSYQNILIPSSTFQPAQWQMNALSAQQDQQQMQSQALEDQIRQHAIDRFKFKDELEALNFGLEIIPKVTFENYPKTKQRLIELGANPDLLPDFQTPQEFEQWKQLTPAWIEKRKIQLEQDKLDQAAKGEPFTLGEGEVRFSPTGERIAEGPPKTESMKPFVDRIDLGDKVRLYHADGTTEDIPKAATPSTMIMGDRRRVSDEMAMRKEFQSLPEVKTYTELQQQIGRARTAIAAARQGSGSYNAIDQSLITILNKMLDPSSVVRESEYARTPEGMSLINRLEGYRSRLAAGGAGISNSERDAIYQMTERLYSVGEDLYTQQANYYRDLAERYGYAPENIVRLGGTKGGQTYQETPNTAGKYLQKFD